MVIQQLEMMVVTTIKNSALAQDDLYGNIGGSEASFDFGSIFIS